MNQATRHAGMDGRASCPDARRTDDHIRNHVPAHIASTVGVTTKLAVSDGSRQPEQFHAAAAGIYICPSRVYSARIIEWSCNNEVVDAVMVEVTKVVGFPSKLITGRFAKQRVNGCTTLNTLTVGNRRRVHERRAKEA